MTDTARKRNLFFICVGLAALHIVYQYSRKKHGRQISLAKRAGDSGDGGDSDIGIPPVTVIDA